MNNSVNNSVWTNVCVGLYQQADRKDDAQERHHCSTQQQVSWSLIYCQHVVHWSSLLLAMYCAPMSCSAVPSHTTIDPVYCFRCTVPLFRALPSSTTTDLVNCYRYTVLLCRAMPSGTVVPPLIQTTATDVLCQYVVHCRQVQPLIQSTDSDVPCQYASQCSLVLRPIQSTATDVLCQYVVHCCPVTPPIQSTALLTLEFVLPPNVYAICVRSFSAAGLKFGTVYRLQSGMWTWRLTHFKRGLETYLFTLVWLDLSA